MILDPWAAWGLVAALLIDRFVIDPDRLWRKLPHPVVGFGAIINECERRLRGRRPRTGGVATVIVLLLVCAGIATALLLLGPIGSALGVGLAAILLAQRSLHAHVERVATALDLGVGEGRSEVAMIVGRDVSSLDEAGIARAAIESLAENFSDGVVAPACWYLLLGPFGVFAYKAVNTADSMIGHRSERYERFGWAAARFDDLLNFVPARLTALLLAIASTDRRTAVRAMLRDARNHRSPNAGWPEAAMAGGLGVALGGPRRYAEGFVEAPFLHAAGRHDLRAADIRRALALYGRALWLLFGLALAFGVLSEV